MSRKHRWHWQAAGGGRCRAAQPPRLSRGNPCQRRLHLELLEDRRLLAGVIVDNNLDAVNGNTSSIANLISDNGGDGISLREAILAANVTSGADSISFAEGLSAGTISLSNGELQITEALTIDARPLAANVTIDAKQLSRIFNITATTGDFTLGGLTLTRGRTIGGGGAVRSLTAGSLTLDRSTVSGNSTTGIAANGGGVYAANGDVMLTLSTVSGNSTAGIGANGGGISAEDVTLTHSTVSGNTAVRGGGGISADSVTLNQSTVSGNSALSGGGGGIQVGRIFDGSVTLNQSTVSGNTAVYGGGISAYGNVTLTQSTVSGNSTTGDFAGGKGGGIYAAYSVTLNQSTVSGNSTAGIGANGGGIWAWNVTLTQSTVSGNSTAGIGANGGGIWAYGNVTLTQSTVTNNHALHASSTGGGIIQFDSTLNRALSISGSVLAGNTAGGGGADLVPDPQSTLTVNYSLIGTGITPTAGGNNISTDAPLLGPLANNGGPTQTHALLAGSPAIDAGDPGITLNPTVFDQRGAPFVRVVDGDAVPGARIDIGAFELQPIPAAFYGDYNQNNVVDAADYVVWRKTLGQSGHTPYSGADGNGNGLVDQDDYDVWRGHFGMLLQVTPAVSNSAASEAVPAASAQEAGFAFVDSPSSSPDTHSRSRMQRYRVDQFASDDLLLLALDRIGRSERQNEPKTIGDEPHEQHIHDADDESSVDEPLAPLLTEGTIPRTPP